MKETGDIRKMASEYGKPVQYFFRFQDHQVPINDLVGHQIKLEYEGEIHCKRCGRKTNKSFAQGFCYPCFRDAPENSPCIIRPELCEGHLGQGRDAEWEKEHHVQPHVVYLALTSGIKVGVTRQDQVPTRWIDQGAWKAIRLAETPYRQLAGQIEVALKEHIADKTPWQRMLKDERLVVADLLAEKQRLAPLLPENLQEYLTDNDEITELLYPVPEYPNKIKSMKLEKVPVIEARLRGIRGQYLIFEDGRVINIRSHAGFMVTLSA